MKKILFGLLVLVLTSSAANLHGDNTNLGPALRLYYSGDHQGAVDAFKQIIAQDPENAGAYYYLGYTYQEMGNYPAAREAFTKTYEINPDFVPQLP